MIKLKVRMIIALDGPAGSGKSTTAKLVGKEIGFLYIDTGAMYRAMTLKTKLSNVAYQDKNGITSLLADTKIAQEIDNQSGDTITFLDGKDVSQEIRTPEINKGVGPVCEISEVRKALVALQREMGQKGDVILDGRDIGTVVFPDADLKFYMIADIKVRALRRYQELLAKGVTQTLEEVENDIAERDLRDSSRADSPLKPADDVIYVDTTSMSISEQVGFIVDKIRTISK